MGSNKYRFTLLLVQLISVLVQLTQGSQIIFEEDDIQEINSICQINNTEEFGICKKIYDCPSSLQGLPKVFPQICFFDRSEIVVCCKNEENTEKSLPNSRSKRQRISERKCQSLYNLLPEKSNSEIMEMHSLDHSDVESIEVQKMKTLDYFQVNRNVTHMRDFEINPVLLELLLFNTTNDFLLNIMVPFGGKPAESSEFLHMVALGWKKPDSWEIEFKCGGFLVDEDYIITAAHCLATTPHIARVGGINLTDRALSFSDSDVFVERAFIHPDYKPFVSLNDIAIVKLLWKVTKSIARPACLWTEEVIPNKHLFAVGYGEITYGGLKSDVLLKLNLTLFDNTHCNELFTNPLHKTQVCAGHPSGEQDTCLGDSGGPLGFNKEIEPDIIVPYIVGITSFGIGCGVSTGAAYTQISSHIDWIESIVWENKI